MLWLAACSPAGLVTEAFAIWQAITSIVQCKIALRMQDYIYLIVKRRVECNY